MASKFYAVKRGKIKGIFYTWADCKQMVDGYPNPVYKSFPTVEEADAFIRGEKVSADAATAEKSGSTQTDTDKTEGEQSDAGSAMHLWTVLSTQRQKYMAMVAF